MRLRTACRSASPEGRARSRTGSGATSATASRLGAAVTAVEDGASGISVWLADGTREHGARAILAVPLTTQREIGFQRALPHHRRLALERARYGDVVKAGLAYDAPPRERRPTLTDAGLVYEPAHGLVVVFAGAAAARRLDALAPPERELALAHLAGGEPRAVRFVSWAEEPFARGSYVVFGAGDLTSWGRRLAEPHGRIHFAGAEASSLPSYMEGAVRAGERAAAEVLAAA